MIVLAQEGADRSGKIKVSQSIRHWALSENCNCRKNPHSRVLSLMSRVGDSELDESRSINVADVQFSRIVRTMSQWIFGGLQNLFPVRGMTCRLNMTSPILFLNRT